MQAYEEIQLARKPSHAVLRPTAIQVGRELEVLSQLMYNQFRIPVLGWRFGLNAIIDLIPQFGDVATTIVALYVLVSAVRYRVPKITLLRMGVNIAIYFVVGLIPLAGDLFANRLSPQAWPPLYAGEHPRASMWDHPFARF